MRKLSRTTVQISFKYFTQNVNNIQWVVKITGWFYPFIKRTISFLPFEPFYYLQSLITHSVFLSKFPFRFKNRGRVRISICHRLVAWASVGWEPHMYYHSICIYYTYINNHSIYAYVVLLCTIHKHPTYSFTFYYPKILIYKFLTNRIG